MNAPEELLQKLREDFARSGGLARAKKLSAKRIAEISRKAGSAPKKKRKK